MTDVWTSIVGNVAAVTTVSIFVWYLIRRDKQLEDAFRNMATMHVDALAKLSELTLAINRLDNSVEQLLDRIGRPIEQHDSK